MLVVIDCILTSMFMSRYIFSQKAKMNWTTSTSVFGKIYALCLSFLTHKVAYFVSYWSPRNLRYRKLHFGKNNGNTRDWSLIGNSVSHILLCVFPPSNILLMVLFEVEIRLSCMWPILMSRIKWAYVANLIFCDNHFLVFSFFNTDYLFCNSQC